MHHKELLNRALDQVKKHPIVERIFKEYDVDLDELDLVPLCFADLDVSARTDHAIIYLNNKLLESPEEIPHYLVHELTHWCQQTTGNKPTKGADDGNYLDNEEEIEGFQNQTEYMADTEGEEEAESYVDRVLDHHDVTNNKEREKRKEELLQLASI